MTTTFERCFQKLLINEGGYAHLAGDRGGRTWYGVSERAQPAYFQRILEATTPKERVAIARECYHQQYWASMRCESMPEPLAFRLFDAAVLIGPIAATRCLQRALVVAGADIVVDGLMGPKTFAAAQKRWQRYERTLVGWTTWYVGAHFQNVAENPEQRKFLWGWGKRLIEPELTGDDET